MPLVKCKDCDNEVSTSASACPRCGAPLVSKPENKNGKLSGWAKFGMAFIAFFLIIILVPVYLEQRKVDDEVARIKSLPLMPIEVQYRQALMGSGLVGSFKNRSNRFLTVIISLENPSLNQQKVFRVDLAPDQVKEIGHLEGWTFASGDLINISHVEYQTLEVKIP